MIQIELPEKKKKFKKKHWFIIKLYLDQWVGEIHHYVKGQKEEALSLVLPMSCADHGVQFSHAKNWHDSQSVPREIKLKCMRFWKNLLSPEHYQQFINEGYGWI